MTSKERNERMKYGHDVPRWWIPDFHMTHKNATREKESNHNKTTKHGESNIKEHYELKRRSRLIAKRQQLTRMNKDIQALQKATAILVIVIGVSAGGLAGLGIGACIGLALLALRLEI
jgi:chemotaxis response regulator CheB